MVECLLNGDALCTVAGKLHVHTYICIQYSQCSLKQNVVHNRFFQKLVHNIVMYVVIVVENMR